MPVTKLTIIFNEKRGATITETDHAFKLVYILVKIKPQNNFVGELFEEIPFITSSDIIESIFVPHLLFLSKFKSGNEPVP